MNAKISQAKVYLIYSAAIAFLFSMVFTVTQLYRIDTLQLNPLQLVLVGTVLEASCFIFEVPTGIVADIKSRKLSVIIGLILIGLAFVLEGSVPLFVVVIFSQFLWGLGYTFTSGADEAWIADEMGGENLEPIFLKGAQASQTASFAGIVISTLIGAKLVNLPMIIGGLMFVVLAVFLMLFMKEPNFKPAPAEDRNSWAQMKHTLMEGIRSIKASKVLILMMAITFLYGLYSEGYDRLWTAHFINGVGFPKLLNLKPVVWIGVINGIGMLLSIATVEYIKRRMEKTGELDRVWILTLINILMVVSMVLFGLAGNFAMAMSMNLLFYVLRTTNGPIYRAWRNKNIKSEVRATVVSTYGQIDALGQIVGGPIIGFVALKTSVSAAIVVSAIILSPVIVLLIFGTRKLKAVSSFVVDEN
jgi:DHA3 family tetracycline resistance protein-like MFS transporter